MSQTYPFSQNSRFGQHPDFVNDMVQYTVYESPLDFPGKYVIRQFVIRVNGTRPLTGFVCDTIEQARSLVPDGMVRLMRTPQDHPSVVEVWI